MKIICPVQPQNFDDFLLLQEKIKDRADIIEIWLDYLDDIDDFLKKFSKRKASKTPFLAVCKKDDQKGKFKKGEEERIKVLQQFLSAGGDLIDLDITKNPKSEIPKIPKKKLILSFHDFENIPPNLDEIFEEMSSFDPLIYKFAVTTDTEADLEKFINFAQNFPKDKKAIFATMGNLGHFGRERMKELTWGQFFAINNRYKTASGQKTLEDVFKT